MVATACGSGGRAEPESAPELPATAVEGARGADPWSVAPAGTAIGIVAQPRALARFGAAWMEAERAMAASVPTAAWASRLAELRRRLPVARIDAEGLRAAGIDPDGGAALFLDARAALMLAVLPVVDPDLFVAAAGGQRAGEGWRVAGLMCGVRAVGFVCGVDEAGIEAALAGGEPGLRKRVMGLPAAARGQIELVGDLAAMPDMAGVRARLGTVLSEPGLVVASVRAGDAVELRLWVQGMPVPPWGTLLAEPSALAAIDAVERGAPGGLRVRFALPQLIAFLLPPTAVPDRPDLATVLLDLFTGDVVMAGGGRGPFAGELALGLADAAGVRAALPGLCRSPLGALGRVRRAEPGRCTIAIDLPPERAQDPLASAALELIHGRTVQISVDGDLLRVTADGAGGGPVARSIAALGSEPWQLRAWASVPDLLLGLPAPLRARVDARLAELAEPARLQLAALRWLADELAGVAVAVRLDDRGFHLLIAADLVARDPLAARQAWAEALAAERAGDLSGFRARLVALLAAHPGTRAATQATLLVR